MVFGMFNAAFALAVAVSSPFADEDDVCLTEQF
jgi:hypothetical protein